MIIITKVKHGIPYSYVWFSDKPSFYYTFFPTVYMCTSSTTRKIGYIHKPQYTKHIDLTPSKEEILKSFGKSTSYKIRRAIRDDVTFDSITSQSQFIEFYNEFAATKNHERITRGQLNGWGAYIHAFAATHHGANLVMHSYIVDRVESRARLLHSASNFRQLSHSHDRNFVGRANRFLHYSAMTHFKDQGIRLYDLGGYARNTTDKELIGINRFKDEFGGDLIEECMFESFPMVSLRLLSKFF